MAKTAVKYTRLRPTVNYRGDRDKYHDDQFEDPDTARLKPPLKSIALAVFLFVAGSVMLVLGSLMLAGIIGHYGGRAVPLLIVGTICFIPGFYNVRIAYLAWKGYHGYSFDDIPSYSD